MFQFQDKMVISYGLLDKKMNSSALKKGSLDRKFNECNNSLNQTGQVLIMKT